MTSHLDDVHEFHQKFGLGDLVRLTPGFPPLDLLEFRRKFMQEELDEFTVAVAKGDLALAADALVDLEYVLMGTIDFMHLPHEQLWRAVHRANMQKVRATHVDHSTRKSTYDVVKPPGWTHPDIAAILKANGATP